MGGVSIKPEFPDPFPRCLTHSLPMVYGGDKVLIRWLLGFLSSRPRWVLVVVGLEIASEEWCKKYIFHCTFYFILFYFHLSLP